MTLEPYLITHCAPTLASLKTASLFSLRCTCEEELRGQLEAWDRRLSEKGVRLTVLGRREDAALVYVCRQTQLEADLRKPGVARFLAAYGYAGADAAQAVARLRERLAETGDFPHEIGLFLGYPLGDVVGFIRNAGRNCKCCGCWKVYCNPGEARRQFAKFRKCSEVYARLWRQGRSVWQLTVAA